MARRRPIDEEIEQWFCHAPAADVQTMLVGLRLICRARGDVAWPEVEGKRKRNSSVKSATPQGLLLTGD